MDLAGALRWGMWGAVFSFMFVDLFDSVGTIVACSYEAGMVAEDGSVARLDRVSYHCAPAWLQWLASCSYAPAWRP